MKTSSVRGNLSIQPKSLGTAESAPASANPDRSLTGQKPAIVDGFDSPASTSDLKGQKQGEIKGG